MTMGGQAGSNQVGNSSRFSLPDLELTSIETGAEPAKRASLPDLELTGGQVAPPVYDEALINKAANKEGVELAESLYEMAGLRAKDGDHTSAQRLLSHALLIVEEKLGSEHIAAAQILSNLGTVHLLKGNYEYAERFLHRAIIILDSNPGMELEIAHAFNNLSAVYNKLGEYSDGERCLQEALSIMEQVLLDELGHTNHGELIPILENYAELMTKTNRPQEATRFKRRIDAIKLNIVTNQAA